ncbi:MAG: phosphatidylglycerophosphatase A [Arcobacteraceae bacterium]
MILLPFTVSFSFVVSQLFFNFRLFDIWKPSIIGSIDKNMEGVWDLWAMT